MKRKLLVLMAVLMAAVSPAWAYVGETTTVTIDGIIYDLKSDGKAEVGNNSYSTVSAVVIPETITHTSGTYDVTSIASGAFSEAKAKTIKVGNNVVSIGDEAFKYCKQLETLIIGTGVETIGDFILRMTGSLEDYSDKTIIALPTTAPSIGSITDSYYFCKIVSIKVPKGSLDSYKGTQKWNSYNISEIDPDAVLDYKNFDSTNHTATVMFSVAADRSQSLGSVDIPASVEKDGVTYDVTAVAEYGFAGCTGITTIKLPPTITSIGANAFSGCSTLTKLYLTSANVPSIGTDALVSGLKIMVTEAGYDNIYTALGGSYTIEKLKEISYKTVSGKPLAVGTGNLKGTTDCYVYYSGKQGTIVYEGDITEIDYSAFKENTDLQEIEFKASVGALADGCFSGCTALTTAVLPEGFTSLPINTFNGCTSLTSVKLPEGITKINSGAFANCTSLKTLVIPASVGTITYDAFENCTGSGFNLVVLPSSAPGIDFGGVTNADNKFKGFTPYKVSVHNNARTSYSNDDFWKQYSIHSNICIKYQTLGNAVGTLDKDADFGTPVISHYYNSTDGYCYLEFAEAPKIGTNAFKGFDQLDCLIEVPTGLTSIGASAFEGCTKLRHFQVPTTVKTIGADAFKDCTGLNDLTYTGTLADWCEITFGNAAANPMNGMAAGTGTINNGSPIFDAALTIPSGIETLKAYTFVNSYITSLNLGEVTAIGNGSFKGCSALATITVSTNEPATLGENAFSGIDENHEVRVPVGNYMAYKNDVDWGKLNLTPLGGAMTLVDDGKTPYEIDQTIADCEISYTRTFINDKWNALYLPFALEYEEWEEYGDVAELNCVHQYDTDDDGVLDYTTIEFNRVTGGAITPNTPYVFKPKTDEAVTFHHEGTLYAAPEEDGSVDCSSTKQKYTLYGNYEVKTGLYGAGAYALSPNGVFVKALNENQTLKPYRIYLLITDKNGGYNSQYPTNAPMRVGITVDGETTGIDEVEIIREHDGACYDLSGRKISEPAHGIFIQNGKKVLIK